MSKGEEPLPVKDHAALRVKGDATLLRIALNRPCKLNLFIRNDLAAIPRGEHEFQLLLPHRKICHRNSEDRNIIGEGYRRESLLSP